MANGRGGARPQVAEEEEEAEQNEEEEDDKRCYIMFNRAAYYVPPSQKGDQAGRIRDHCTCIEVEDAATLGQMNKAENWPKPEEFPPLAIVVVKGRHDESSPLSTDSKTGPFHWYARVVIKNNANPNAS